MPPQQIDSAIITLTGTSDEPCGSLVGPGLMQVVFRLDELTTGDEVLIKLSYEPPSLTTFVLWAKAIEFGVTVDEWWDGAFGDGDGAGYATPWLPCPSGQTAELTIERVAGAASIDVEYEAFSL